MRRLSGRGRGALKKAWTGQGHGPKWSVANVRPEFGTLVLAGVGTRSAEQGYAEMWGHLWREINFAGHPRSEPSP